MIPGTDEAAALVAMMKRQAAAFCYYYLNDQGLLDQFAHDLVVALLCCPEQVPEITKWNWDWKQKNGGTKGKVQGKDGGLNQGIRSFRLLQNSQKLKTGLKSKDFSHPQARFNLDKEISVGTVQAQNEEKRRQQKICLEENSLSEEGKYDSDGWETEQGEEDNNQEVSINSNDSGEESREQRSNKENEEDSVGHNLLTESVEDGDDGENDWGDDDVVI